MKMSTFKSNLITLKGGGGGIVGFVVAVKKPNTLKENAVWSGSSSKKMKRINKQIGVAQCAGGGGPWGGGRSGAGRWVRGADMSVCVFLEWRGWIRGRIPGREGHFGEWLTMVWLGVGG